MENKNIEEKQKHTQKKLASIGNRTRVTRVAGEYSTTRPPMQTGIETEYCKLNIIDNIVSVSVKLNVYCLVEMLELHTYSYRF